MYHDVVKPGSPDSSGFPGKGPARYKLDWDLFRSHLDAIAAAGGRPESVLGVQNAGRSRGWPLMLTFDDGGASAEPIGEALSARGWTAHFFVSADFVGRPGFLDEGGVRRLAQMGHVIGTHSCSHHVPFSGLSEDRLLEEWGRSVSTLTEIVGSAVVVGSVPGGYSSRRVELAAAHSGLQALFTSQPVASVRRVDGCLVLGRYAILSGASSVAVERLVRGDAAPRLRQLVSWKARGLAKLVLGDRYRALRARLLETG
jgi:peptidoglycan/xylan/chitin deacetylase (PgdA/CDA1 family)